MSEDRFSALRDRGTELWTEIEAYRLSVEQRITRLSRVNLILSIMAALAGAVAGASGIKLLNEFGAGAAWVATVAGFISAATAAVNPVLKLSDGIQRTTELAKELKALQDQIRNHIYRMQVMVDFTVDDQHLFFVQRADDVRALTSDLGTGYRAFLEQATTERDRNAFPKLIYVGSEIEEESVQEAAADISAFGMGE